MPSRPSSSLRRAGRTRRERRVRVGRLGAMLAMAAWLLALPLAETAEAVAVEPVVVGVADGVPVGAGSVTGLPGASGAGGSSSAASTTGASGPASATGAAGGTSAASAPAAAASGPACTRPLTLGLNDHGLLYSSQTGEGINKDIAEELARRSGCRITLLTMPRARIWQLLESGNLDFTLSAVADSSRVAFASFAWYMSNRFFLLVRRDAGVRSIEEFRNAGTLKLGMVRSARYGPMANRFIDELDHDQRVVYASAIEPLYQILIENHVQGMIVEPIDDPAVQGAQLRPLTALIPFDDQAVLRGLAMSRKSLPPEQQEAWREVMLSMRSDGTVHRIFEKYFPPELARVMTQF